jgi:3-methyladenine DNA glycosylase/8-oxoguanine DNA glycosylase
MDRRSIRSTLPVDLQPTLSAIRAGAGDPAVAWDGHAVLVATRTPAGPGTIRFSGGGHRVDAEAWGPGSAWLLDRAAAICGADDSFEGFRPAHPIVGDLSRRYRGLRVIRTGAVVEATIRTVVGQKVTGREAKDGYRRMARALGERAPGPLPLLLPPDPEALAGLAYHRFHPWGIERKRAEAIIAVARRRNRLAEACDMGLAAAYRRLRAVHGVGPWTCGIVGGIALGDADAVPVGDDNIPDLVCWALAGEPRGDDDRMLDLLQPYRGHRGRVIRWLEASGIRPPRFGPRAPLRSFRTW